MTREIPSYDTVGQFHIKVPCNDFFGMAGGADIANVTADAMDTAMNVKITYKASFISYLLNEGTLSIYAPAKAHVTGVIVKYN